MVTRTELEDLLGRLETLEEPFHAWGVVGTTLTDDDVDRVIEAWADDAGALADPLDVLDELLQVGMLVKVDGGYRTRIGELLWELANLRQLFPKRDEPDGPAHGWREAPTLVDGFRFSRRPREYPRRDRDPLPLMERSTDPGSVQREVFRLLTTIPAGGILDLAGFQERATETILEQARSNRTTGAIIGAGTGSGKTLAFYLPAFTHIARTLDSNRHLRALALYPRNELLKDQLQNGVEQAVRLAGVLRTLLGRPLRIGAFFGDVPQTVTSLDRDWHRSWRKRGTRRVCPYLNCPGSDGSGCGGELLVDARDRSDEPALRCELCGTQLSADVFAMTRDQMRRRPPDLLFSSTEMLNRSLLDPSTGHILGVDARVGPDLVLLDEVHTYGGTSGAMTALALRRWRNRVNSQPAFVGLSATLIDAPRFFADLVGLHADQVVDIRPDPDELVPEGAEYQLILRADPASGVGLLSTTIQTSMLLARTMDAAGSQRSQGLFGRKVFVFTDDLDVTNRLYFDVLDAEGQRHRRGGALPYKPSLAYLRSPAHPDPSPRRRTGQVWDLSLASGHNLGATDRLRVGRTSSQDVGLDVDAQIVVATASLEVGVDDPSVGGVIQHKAPRDNAAFLQRQGRAGRERGTRPITAVVLSDFGRDRATFEAWDQLLSPLLRPASLPIGNVHVLRMQAVLATLGWAALEAGTLVGETNLWSSLSGPARHDRGRTAQRAVADILRNALTDDNTRERLTNHLTAALRLEPSTVDALLWEPPRPILLGAIPALLRRIHDDWHVTSVNELATGSREDQGARQPLPDFVPPTLFSPLALPEVLVQLPPPTASDPSDEREPESMGLNQALREFAPGRVTKRFAVGHDLDRAWVAVEPGAPTVDIGSFVGLHQRDGEIDGVELLRPLQLSTTRPGGDLTDSSNGRPRWVSHVTTRARGLELFVPDTEPLAALIGDVEAFLHRDQRQIDVLRGVTSSEVSLRYTDGREELSLVSFVRGEDPVLLGGAFSVDALRLRAEIQVPLTLWDDRLGHGLRPAYFRDLLDQRFAGLLNPFLGTWIHDVVFNALLREAIVRACNLEQAWSGIRSELDARLDATLELLFSSAELDLSDHGTTSTPKKLRQRLLKELREPVVQSILDEVVPALWRPPDDPAREWLERRLLRTVGELVLRGAALLCPEHDSDTAVIDVVRSSDGDEVWISERVVGGGGFLEAVVDASAAQPDRLFRLGRATLRPGAQDVAAKSLESIVRQIVDPGPVATAFSEYRRATGATAKARALSGLRAALTQAGFATTPDLVGAVVNRLLRVGSDAALDKRISDSVDRWVGTEERLGVEVPVRTWTLLDSTSGGRVDPEDLERLQTVLWPRGSSPRNARYASYNPYSQEPDPAPAVLEAVLDHEVSEALSVASPDEVWENVVDELRQSGTVRLAADAANKPHILDVLARTATEPVELDHLRVNPRVTHVGATTEGGLEATVELPLLGRWRRQEVEAVTSDPVRSRRVMTSGRGRMSDIEQFHHLLFTLELIEPARPLWIVSAWLSDVAVVDNRGGELLSIAPGLAVRRIGLVEVLTELVGRGGDVRVIVRDDPHNRAVVGRLQQLTRRTTAGSLRVDVRADLHDKVIVGHRLLIEGSMNLTHRGALRNEEGVRIVADATDIATQRHELARRFAGEVG